ncbi:hypothetical protein TNCV_1221371 [Trichonephila clavipes]|nr:hypothetical protein TNCV_1221371 [Trichonephila clavipes]
MIKNLGSEMMEPISIRSSATTLSEALDISITSADTFPQYAWSLLDIIGSDPFLILIEFSNRQCAFINRDKFWNFKKANWDSFRETVDICLASEPMTNDLTHNWTVFKKLSLTRLDLTTQGIMLTFLLILLTALPPFLLF